MQKIRGGLYMKAKTKKFKANPQDTRNNRFSIEVERKLEENF